MIMHVGCTTPTLSVTCSLFTTSVESKMEEHKTVPSGGTIECEDEGCGTNAYGNLMESQQNLREN